MEHEWRVCSLHEHSNLEIKRVQRKESGRSWIDCSLLGGRGSWLFFNRPNIKNSLGAAGRVAGWRHGEGEEKGRGLLDTWRERHVRVGDRVREGSSERVASYGGWG